MEAKSSLTVRGLVNGAVVGALLIVAFPTVFKLFPLGLVSPEMAKSVSDPGDGSGAGWGILLVVGAPSFLVFTAAIGAVVALGLSAMGIKSRLARGGVAAAAFVAVLVATSKVGGALPQNLITMGLTLTLMFVGPVALGGVAAIAGLAFALTGPRQPDA